MIKKISTLILFCMLTLCLFSCGNSGGKVETKEFKGTEASKYLDADIVSYKFKNTFEQPYDAVSGILVNYSLKVKENYKKNIKINKILSADFNGIGRAPTKRNKDGWKLIHGSYDTENNKFQFLFPFYSLGNDDYAITATDDVPQPWLTFYYSKKEGNTIIEAANKEFSNDKKRYEQFLKDSFWGMAYDVDIFLDFMLN